MQVRGGDGVECVCEKFIFHAGCCVLVWYLDVCFMSHV